MGLSEDFAPVSMIRWVPETGPDAAKDTERTWLDTSDMQMDAGRIASFQPVWLDQIVADYRAFW